MIGKRRLDRRDTLKGIAAVSAGAALTAFELIGQRPYDFTLAHAQGGVRPLAGDWPWYVLMQVSSGRSGHVEVVQVVFDPTVVSYDTLLEVFWKNVDPLDRGGQFCDRGEQYRTVIYYHSDAQKRQAEASPGEAEFLKAMAKTARDIGDSIRVLNRKF